MNGKLRTAIPAICIMVSVTMVAVAYFSDYDSVLTRPNTSSMVLLLLLVNVMGNIVQIEDFLEKLAADRNESKEEELYEKMRNLAGDLEILLSIIQSEFPRKESAVDVE